MFTDPIQFNYNVKLQTPIEKQGDSKTRKTPHGPEFYRCSSVRDQAG
jgi:hypothetical protein